MSRNEISVGSGRAGMEKEPRLFPLGPAPAHSSCTGLKKQCDPTEAFHLKCLKRFGSRCPAAGCSSDSVAHVAVRDDAVVG